MNDTVNDLVNGILRRQALHFRVSQFYYREARLLDERRLHSWLELLAPDVLYDMPVRHSYLGDGDAVGNERFHAPENEFGTANEAPFRRDDLAMLTMRAERTFYPNVWSENPPPRTNRTITNIELLDGGGSDEIVVASNFLLYFSRHGRDNHLYSGARRDTLRPDGDSFRIARRRILLAWNAIPVPTVGLIF